MLTAWTLLVTTLLWMLFYAVVRAAIRRLLDVPAVQRHIPDESNRAALRSQGAAYLVSAVHALYVTPRGLQHLLRLFRAPLLYKMAAPRPGLPTVALDAARHLAFTTEIARVMHTNLVLSGYLCADAVFVLSEFPRLGGLDIVAHHAAFLFCGVIAGYYRLYPFTFGWLIIGEASTPLLDLRWLLIKLGRGHTTLFTVVQMLFALVFVTNRFFIYGAGLLYHFSMVFSMPPLIPRWAVFSTTGLVALGFLLNFMWLSKIAAIALGKPRRASSTSTATEATLTEAVSTSSSLTNSNMKDEHED